MTKNFISKIHNGLVLQERGNVFLNKQKYKQTWPNKLGKKTWTNNTWPNKLGHQKNLARQTWPSHKKTNN